MTSKTVKIQIITDHLDYKKGQVLDLEEKSAITLLTNGKALKIHRKVSDINTATTEQKTSETPEEKIRKSKNDLW
jgi:hypothetical protein